jgi:hypothetical protein
MENVYKVVELSILVIVIMFVILVIKIARLVLKNQTIANLVYKDNYYINHWINVKNNVILNGIKKETSA